jgi:hypothetical protein
LIKNELKLLINANSNRYHHDLLLSFVFENGTAILIYFAKEIGLEIAS